MIQFTVAATNQNAVGGEAQAKPDSESSDAPCDVAESNKPLLIGHSHSKLTRFTAAQIR